MGLACDKTSQSTVGQLARHTSWCIIKRLEAIRCVVSLTLLRDRPPFTSVIIDVIIKIASQCSVEVLVLATLTIVRAESCCSISYRSVR